MKVIKQNKTKTFVFINKYFGLSKIKNKDKTKSIYFVVFY